jgi:hypothetical protein
MEPAGERLDAPDTCSAQVGDREEVGLDLAALQAHRELALQGESLEQLGAEARLEEAQGPRDRVDLVALAGVEGAAGSREDEVAAEPAVDRDHEGGLG